MKESRALTRRDRSARFAAIFTEAAHNMTTHTKKRALKVRRLGQNAARDKARFPRQKGLRWASGGALAARFFNPKGFVIIDDVARSFGMSKGQLAETVGVR